MLFRETMVRPTMIIVFTSESGSGLDLNSTAGFIAHQHWLPRLPHIELVPVPIYIGMLSEATSSNR